MQHTTKRSRESRASTRVRQRSQAMLIEAPASKAGPKRRVLQTSTKDMSDTGACVLSGPFLQLGQHTQIRVGTSAGLAISVAGRVVRCRGANGGQSGTCEWGIAFDDSDAALLKRYEVFEKGFQRALAKHHSTAAIITRDPRETLHWLRRLPPTVSKVLIPRTSPRFLYRLRQQLPQMQIRALL